MDKKFCEQFRIEMAKALISVEEKMGIKITVGNIKYGFGELETKLSAITLPKDGSSVEETNFKTAAFLYGFKPEDYGAEVNIAGDDCFLLIGFNPKAKKNVCMLRKIKDNGKIYVAPADLVRVNMTNSKK